MRKHHPLRGNCVQYMGYIHPSQSHCVHYFVDSSAAGHIPVTCAKHVRRRQRSDPVKFCVESSATRKRWRMFTACSTFRVCRPNGRTDVKPKCRILRFRNVEFDSLGIMSIWKPHTTRTTSMSLIVSGTDSIGFDQDETGTLLFMTIEWAKTLLHKKTESMK